MLVVQLYYSLCAALFFHQVLTPYCCQSLAKPTTARIFGTNLESAKVGVESSSTV